MSDKALKIWQEYKVLIIVLAFVLVVSLIVLSMGKKHVKLAKNLHNEFKFQKEQNHNEDAQISKFIIKLWKGLGYSDSYSRKLLKQGTAWSAAFISYVMKTSGFSNFPIAAAHSVFFTKIKSGLIPGFKTHRVEEYKPKVGDIVLKWRKNKRTYDTLRSGDYSHSDIVTEVRDGYLETIGGNVGQTVSMTKVPIDGNGFITDSKYIGVIEVK